MADNISVTPGTGVTVSGDDVGGVLFQRVKVSLGNDGIFDGDVSATNPIPATITSSALPSGASTATLQSDGNASLVSIDTKLTDQATAAKQDLLLAELELKADLTETQPVSLASVPLAPDAATETTLAALNTKTPGLGQAVMASSTPVVIASNQTTLPVSAASLPLPAGGSTSALQTTGNNSLASIDAGIPNALGTAVIASSMPVNIASDQVVPISATALPLPTGAATSALQGTGNTSLSSIDTKLSSQATAAKQDLLLAELQLKADLTETQPVSLASIPLATGAATSALQTTGNNSLASIDAGIPAALGQTTMAASMPITIASDQTALPISASALPLPSGAATAALQGTGNTSLSSIDTKLSSQATAAKQDILLAELQLKADLTETQPVSLASIPLATGASTSALQTTGNSSLASIDAGIPNALGAAVIASSMPVNIASDQVVPVSASALPLPSGASTSALQGTGNTSLSSIDTKLTSQATAAKQDILLAELQLKADLTETQPVSLASVPLPAGAATSALQTTGNSSLSSIDGKIPSLGQALMAASSPVVIASNQSTLPVQSGDSLKNTYTAAVQSLVVAATPTDIFTITGSASSVVKIRKIVVSAIQTTSTIQSVSLLKRSTANTAGTSTTQTNVPHDSTNAAATATARSYTANPTLGTLVGRLAVRKLYISAILAANNGQFAPGNFVEFIYDQLGKEPLVLRGTSEVIAVNLPGVTLAGSSFDIFVEWTEE
jgi:hypothetical protein